MATPRIDGSSADSLPTKPRNSCRPSIKDIPRKPPQSPSQLRVRLQGAWLHRGYHVFRKPGGWHATHIMWRLFSRLPLEFYWRDYDDIEGFKRYIDAWYKGDLAHCQMCEKQEIAFNIIFPDQTQVQALQTQQVSCRRLFECLQLTDKADFPLWGRVAFVTNGHYLVPAEYISLLAAANPDGLGHLADQPGPWRAAKDRDLDAMGLKPEDVTSGMYLRNPPKGVNVRAAVSSEHVVPSRPVLGLPDPARPEAPAEVEVAVAPPRERTMYRRDQETYTDWMTKATPDAGAPWFTRRLFRGEHLLYAATAWSADGPWHVWERDSSALLALDLDI